MKIKPKRIVQLTLSVVGIAILTAIYPVGEYYRNKYDQVLSAALGETKKSNSSVSYSGVDDEYYKRQYTDSELLSKQDELSETICEEGFVTLQKGNIPYSQNTGFSLFSESSVDFLYGGTGSGTASSSLTLKTAFEDEGYSVNDKLWDFYNTGNGKSFRRGVGSVYYGDSDDYSINECPLSIIKSDSSLVSSFSSYNTGVFVLSRTGGEGNDLARGMWDYVDTDKDASKGYHKDAESDKNKSYLEPDSIELEVMDYINENFSDFILVVNSNNPIELGWTSNYSKLKTIIQVPGTGNNGLNALPKIIKGEVSSSGKLTDTYAYDAFSSPAMQNMGDFEYLVDGQKMANIKGDSTYNGTYYTNYKEGIYVGYKYYETRYEDCVMNRGNASKMADYENCNSKRLGRDKWSYSNEVQFPFGYGDSISDFTWTDFKVSRNGNDFTASIKVKNTSSYPGKDTVELYAQTPYGAYEVNNNIEKSGVDLIGYQKTKKLQPGEEETVNIAFSYEDLKCYDAYNTKGYIMSSGQYYFTAGFDAHAAINNILRAKGYSNSLTPSPSETEAGNTSLVDSSLNVSSLDAESFKNDSTTGTAVTNQFDFADKKMSDSSYTYLSRNDYVSTYPKTEGEVSNIVSKHSERVNGVDSNNQPVGYEYTSDLKKDSDTYKQIVNFETLSPTEETEQVKWNQDSNLDLIDLRGLDVTDSRYDELVSKMSYQEAKDLISKGGYQTIAVSSINKPKTKDLDGPAGFNTVSGHFALGYTYPCALTIAQTFNNDLAWEVGNLIGEEGIKYDISGWYGPATNIHRTPFGGRNFEYFSEDPYVSGIICKSQLNGAAKNGVYGYLKHFALNDQENHREKENGICTFANEQTIRQLYLKPFELSVKDNKVDVEYYELGRDADKNIIYNSDGEPSFTRKTKSINATTAVMTSFTRIGGVYAGGCYPLVTNVLKKEWGFVGIICTDYYHSWFMDKAQAVRGGGNLILDPQNNDFTTSESDEYYVHQAVKELLYGIVNSNAVNGMIHGTVPITPFPKYMTYVIIIYSVDGVFIGLLGLNIYWTIRKIKKDNLNEVK